MGRLKRLDRQIERLPAGTDPANLEAYLASLRTEGDKADGVSPHPASGLSPSAKLRP